MRADACHQFQEALNCQSPCGMILSAINPDEDQRKTKEEVEDVHWYWAHPLHSTLVLRVSSPSPLPHVTEQLAVTYRIFFSKSPENTL